MNYHAHRIGGICSGLAFSIITMPETNAIPYVALMTTSALVGSLLPDIDEPNSFIGKKVKPISKIIKWTAGHRGLFHTFLICLISKHYWKHSPWIGYWILIAFVDGYDDCFRSSTILAIHKEKNIYSILEDKPWWMVGNSYFYIYIDLCHWMAISFDNNTIKFAKSNKMKRA